MCQTGFISYWSFWGCGNNPAVRNHVSLAITTSSNVLLMPPNPFFTYADVAGRWSELPGYNSFSPEIILSRFSAYSVSEGQELRLWYGEIWWVILKAIMEDWSSAMFTLFMSEILSLAKIAV